VWAVIAAALALTALGGCGGGEAPSGELQRLGASEGELDLVVLPGYAEDGSKAGGPDWVTQFEQQTGCEVRTKAASAPGEVMRLMRSGRFDGVSARGNVGGALIAGGLVDPVNTDLLPNYDDVFPSIKDKPDNTVDGVTYGVPQGRTANLLIWKPADVKRETRKKVSSNLIFDPELAARYAGRIGIPDNPMYIADAAIYLRKHEPDLGIDNVYELDREQFEAAIALLREQRPFLGRYWRSLRENAETFGNGATVAGTGTLATSNALRAGGVKVLSAVPYEGATGLSDNWMISSRARHPNCMYRWMNHVLSPAASAAIAVQTGQAPANERACNLIGEHCDNYRAADEDLFEDVDYWTTPLRDCGDDRGDACMGYPEWARAFAELKRTPTVGPAAPPP
jgi:putative spermidine/putrescine transport system substrate-binding protein